MKTEILKLNIWPEKLVILVKEKKTIILTIYACFLFKADLVSADFI